MFVFMVLTHIEAMEKPFCLKMEAKKNPKHD